MKSDGCFKLNFNISFKLGTKNPEKSVGSLKRLKWDSHNSNYNTEYTEEIEWNFSRSHKRVVQQFY